MWKFALQRTSWEAALFQANRYSCEKPVAPDMVVALKTLSTVAFATLFYGMAPPSALRIVTCDPIAARMERDIILVGPPGHGRTSTAAKLTRRAAVARTAILPIAADLDGTAGGAQLAAYLEQERGQIRNALTPDALFDTLRTARAAGHRCVIDLPSINAFDQDDMDSLQDLIQVVRAEPVLVMSAEGHPEDQADAARIFARAGIRRAILTKLDIARRRGGAISALSSAGIAFSHLAVTPFIGGGLVPAAPSRLAALLMEDAPGDVIALKGAA